MNAIRLILLHTLALTVHLVLRNLTPTPKPPPRRPGITMPRTYKTAKTALGKRKQFYCSPVRRSSN